ncbi:MAG: LuxR C-terminal-related transcriptional regulator [Dehalococcoidia bacterium]
MPAEHPMRPSPGSVRDALAWQFADGGRARDPAWQLFVRPRGEEALRNISTFEGVGPIDDWAVLNGGFGRLFSTFISIDGRPVWDQYGIDEGPLAPRPGPAGMPRRDALGGAVVVPYVGTPGGGCLVGVIRHERPLPGIVTVELPRGFAEPGETAQITAISEMIEEFGVDGYGPSRTQEIRRLGRINANTAFYTGFVEVYAARFQPQGEAWTHAAREADAREVILPWTRSGRTGLLVPLARLCRPGAIECGISAAALWHFRAFLEHESAEPMDTASLIEELEGQSSAHPIEPLDEREKQLLRLAADGLTDADIAHEIGLAPGSLRNMFSEIYQKLGVPNRPAAVAEAFRQGIIT